MAFELTIDGRRVESSADEMVLGAARRLGIQIPTLCHHEAVEPFGACRLCVVEITKPAWKGWKGIMTSCLYPCAPDLMVETDSERVRRVRRNVLDLLLARCPGSDLIARLAAQYGLAQTSFQKREDPDLCILCGLCVRICESAATAAISTVQRGHSRRVGTPWGGPPPDCVGCLACAHICPTGHIRYSEHQGVRRIWDQDFALVRCTDTGQFLPVTERQAEFLAKRQKMDRSYLSRSAVAQRRTTAATFGRIARWNKLGLTQEEAKR